MRRFESGNSLIFAGLKVRIRAGSKVPGDLVAEWLTPEGWRAIPMSFGQFLADFFSENEQEIAKYRGHWQFNGDTYYLRSLYEAARHGWKVPANRTAAQRATE